MLHYKGIALPKAALWTVLAIHLSYVLPSKYQRKGTQTEVKTSKNIAATLQTTMGSSVETTAYENASIALASQSGPEPPFKPIINPFKKSIFWKTKLADGNDDNQTDSKPETQENVLQSSTSGFQNYSVFNLTDTEFKKCIKSNHKYSVNAREGRLHFNFVAKTVMLSSGLTVCEVRVSVSKNRLILFEKKPNIEGCGVAGKWVVLDGLTATVLGEYRCSNSFHAIYSRSNWIIIRFKLGIMTLPVNSRATFKFKEIQDSDMPQLEFGYFNSTSGFIQSPWLKKKDYPAGVDVYHRLDVPNGYDVMASFPLFRLIKANLMRLEDYDRLKIYMGNASYERLWHSRFGTTEAEPEVIRTRFLKFHFHTKTGLRTGSDTGLGFKILFSFHNQSALPTKRDDGKWDCSTSLWPEFKLHFPCNAYPDCGRGEDEEDCFYTSSRCGVGYITAGQSCHFLVKNKIHRTLWKTVRAECRGRNGHLSTFNTKEEWDDIRAALRLRNADNIYVGIRSTSITMPSMYRKMHQWVDGTMAYLAYVWTDHMEYLPTCGFINTFYLEINLGVCRNDGITEGFLCERDDLPANHQPSLDRTVSIPPLDSGFNPELYVQCPDGQWSHAFLACDPTSRCWGQGYGADFTCRAPLPSLPRAFVCHNTLEQVPYTAVCDHRSDCGDDSDESLCTFDPCDNFRDSQCEAQCIHEKDWCDGMKHCLMGEDELMCYRGEFQQLEGFVPSPAIIRLDGRGKFTAERLHRDNTSSANHSRQLCPQTHFQCPDDGYCLPVFVRCNGIYDCPGKEDEDGCDSYRCPNYYRCRSSLVCLHPDYVCDGIFQCPQNDDEKYCDLPCPDQCMCHGLAYSCSESFPSSSYPSIRFLIADRIAMNMTHFSKNRLLIYLSLSMCQMTTLRATELPNLQTFDVSHNNLKTLRVKDLQSMIQLKELVLTGNPLTSFLLDGSGVLESITLLDLSAVIIPDIAVFNFSAVPRLKQLNMSGSEVLSAMEESFRSLQHLQMLDMRGCPMIFFHKSLLSGLASLQAMHADNYVLCCPVLLPDGFNVQKCAAPRDEIASCENLLRSDLYRVFLFLFVTLALCGNLVSLVYRLLFNRASLRQSFGVFVCHLCVSDLLMGVYLGVIGVADRVYSRDYVWMDHSWRHSSACTVAGFLSLLSNEVSALIICLITLDRFVVLRFPFSGLRFHRRSAQLACGLAWAVGLGLAAVPLLPPASHWHFYSQTGICIPLPVTRNDYEGHNYSFAILIIFNFVLFLLIAAGQLSVYWSIRSNSMQASLTLPAASSTANTTTTATAAAQARFREQTIARRLLTVAMSDFFCWFPIGLLGLLASRDVPVPSELNVAMAIMVLPLNSAINPFLYTLNMIAERRRRIKEERLLQLLTAQIRAQKRA